MGIDRVIAPPLTNHESRRLRDAGLPFTVISHILWNEWDTLDKIEEACRNGQMLAGEMIGPKTMETVKEYVARERAKQ